MVNCKWLRRKLLCPNLSFCPRISLYGLRKTTKPSVTTANRQDDIWTRGAEFEAGDLANGSGAG
jgi:hypothetical protein